MSARAVRLLQSLLCPVLLAACQNGSSPTGAHTLSLSTCEVGGETANCGFLPVPEDWNNPSARMIRLNVLVLPAAADDGSTMYPPLVDLAGGPGLAATAGAGYYTTDGKAWRRDRDIVLFDQRGTGGSAPANCRAFGSASTLSPMYPREEVRQCAGELGRTHDLARYSTPAAVKDLEAVREALDAEQIDIFAMSYGTRLAQAYIREYPRRVRSAVFLGTVPMDPKSPLPHARNAETVLQAIFGDCERDAACIQAHPRLRQDWELLGELLERRQVTADTGGGERVIETGPFMEAFRTILASEAGQRKVPALVAALAAGNTAPFLEMIGGAGPGVAEGAYLSIECTEGTNRIEIPEIGPATANTFAGRYRVDQQLGACSVWPRTDVPQAFFEPVVSDVPVLLVVGGRDATTPAAWSEAVAAGFRNSAVLVVEEMGHVPVEISNIGCLDRLMLDFYATPLSVPDAACIGNMRAPPFHITPIP